MNENCTESSKHGCLKFLEPLSGWMVHHETLTDECFIYIYVCVCVCVCVCLKSSPLLITWSMSSLSCTRCSNAKSHNLWKVLLLNQHAIPKFCHIDCSWSDSSVSEIAQAQILEWVAISFSRGSTPARESKNVGERDVVVPQSALSSHFSLGTDCLRCWFFF